MFYFFQPESESRSRGNGLWALDSLHTPEAEGKKASDPRKYHTLGPEPLERGLEEEKTRWCLLGPQFTPS